MAARGVSVVSSKGQVVLPKAVRDELGWDAGTQLTVEASDRGVVLRATPVFAPAAADEVFGCLKTDGAAKTLGEIEAGVAAMAKARHGRGRY